MANSNALGEPRQAALAQGTIHYREAGSGPPLVFVHGALVNGDLWRKVVPLLADRYRCIAPDLPLGSHPEPMAPGADLTPLGQARMIDDFTSALDLDGVTLVSNDTGTGLAQIVMTETPQRLRAAVLTSGDAFWNFPPHALKPLQPLMALPGADSALRAMMGSRQAARAFYGGIARSLKDDDEAIESYTRPVLQDDGVLRDALAMVRAIRPRYTLVAAEKLPAFQHPVLVVWAPEDRFFPNSHGRRLADLVPNGRLEEVRDSLAFISEDQPQRLAELIGGFAGR